MAFVKAARSGSILCDPMEAQPASEDEQHEQHGCTYDFHGLSLSSFQKWLLRFVPFACVGGIVKIFSNNYMI